MSDKMPELKPCPFCGSKPEYVDALKPWIKCTGCADAGSVWVNCFRPAGFDYPLRDAVQWWNQRADLPKEVDLGAVTENVLSILFNRTGSNRHIFYAKSIINTVLDHLVALGVIKDKGV